MHLLRLPNRNYSKKELDLLESLLLSCVDGLYLYYEYNIFIFYELLVKFLVGCVNKHI